MEFINFDVSRTEKVSKLPGILQRIRRYFKSSLKIILFLSSLTYGQASAKIHVIYLHFIDPYVTIFRKFKCFSGSTYVQNAGKLLGFSAYVEINEIIILYIIRSLNPGKLPGF